MELAIVGLFAVNMVLSVICWGFYEASRQLQRMAENDDENRAKLLREIEHLKADNRAKDRRYGELDEKLKAIGGLIEPKPAVFAPYDTEDSHTSDILARHGENQ